MGLSSLIHLIGTSKPRFVTIEGRLISGEGVQVSNGLATHPKHGPVTHVVRHADHGGPEGDVHDDHREPAWWLTSPDRLATEAAAMARQFPGFRPIICDGRPGWAGTINTGYGRFQVEVVHRPGTSALPVARVIGRRLERKEGRRFRVSDHLFASGALCYARTEDYRPTEGHNAVTVVAWIAHWLAEYVHWRLNGVWPSKGPIGAAL